MARPRKKGLDYFPVDTSFDDETESFLDCHGGQGMLFLIRLWQTAYKTDDGRVELSDSAKMKSFLKRCRVTKSGLDRMMETACSLGLCSTIDWRSSITIIWVGISGVLKEIQQEREKARERFNSSGVIRRKTPEELPKNPTKERKVNINNSTSSLRSDVQKPPPLEQIKLGSHVRITQEQKNAFIQEDGEDEFNTRIQTINDYCAANRKSYADYAAAYRNFRKRDRERHVLVVRSRPLTTFERNQEIFKKWEAEDSATQRNESIIEVNGLDSPKPDGERGGSGRVDVLPGGYFARRSS